MKVPAKLNLNESMKLYKESAKLFPAGVNSNARAWRTTCPTYMPCTLFIKKAIGSKIWDVDGNKYIDYRLAYGPIILGHSHPAVHKAVHAMDEKDVLDAFEHENAIEAAMRIKKCMPSVELMRFCNSGTEATMSAVRVARAYTKKNKILKFDGHYHGHHDYLLFSTHHRYGSEKAKYVKMVPASLGIPDYIKRLVIVEDWNNFYAIEKRIKKQHSEIAAVITEPIMGNAAAIMPRHGYLRHLKELCERYDILLIFDEVKTGFRVSLGGAQELFKVKPHLTTMAKAMGNGYPVAAFGGLRDVMEMIGPGKVMHGGTYSANPVSMAATNATLRVLAKKKTYSHIKWYGQKLMKGVHAVLEENKIPHLINGVPAMFQVVFTRRHHIHNYRELRYCDKPLSSRFQYELLKRGVMIDEDMEEPLYVSLAHSKQDLEHTINAYEDSVKDALVPRTSLRVKTFQNA